MYTEMDVNKFYPLVYGQDIASVDSDENSAGYILGPSSKLELHMIPLSRSRK